MVGIHSRRSPVVSRENHDGVFAQFSSLEKLREQADLSIHLCDHLRVRQVFAAGGNRHRLVEVIGDVVTERHRVKRKERFIVLHTPVDERLDELAVNVRSKLLSGGFIDLAVLVNHRLVIARALVPTEHAVFVKAHAVWLQRIIPEQSQLPLAGYHGRVTGCLHGVGNRPFFEFGRESAPLWAIHIDGVSAGQDGNPGWVTNRHAVTMHRLQTALGQRIQIRRRIRFPPVTTQRFIADVVR